MGAKEGRKGARSYNLLTCGVGSWRKYLDKCRRKAARTFAIKEQMELSLDDYEAEDSADDTHTNTEETH